MIDGRAAISYYLRHRLEDVLASCPPRPFLNLEEGRPTFVWLMVRDARNEALLSGFLEDSPSLQRIPAGGEHRPGLILTDGPSFSAHRPLIEEAKDRSSHRFVPLLLLIPDDGRVRMDSEETRYVDDFLELPIRKAILRLRIRQLLRARSFSIRADRRRLEIERRERTYRVLCESSPDAILVVDEGHVRYANTAAADLLGATDSESLVGDSISVIASEPSGDALTEEIRSVLVGRRDSFAVETRLVPEGQDPRHAEVHGAPTRFEGTRRVQLTLRDVTERTRRNEQLLVLERILQHDLRKDITSTMGWAELVGSGTDLERSADRIRAAGNHMVETLNAAGALQHAMRTGDQMERKPTPIHGFAREAVEIVRMRHPEADLTFESHLDPDTTVQANNLLGSVLENLIANAVRHNDRDEPRVIVSLERESGRVRATVVDDGPGIPESVRERMFEAGAQGLDSNGLGLGLYLVSMLVDQFGGSIVVGENRPRGTRISVDLAPLPDRDYPEGAGTCDRQRRA